MKFDDWWAKAKHDFDNARATSFYRYQLPAFQDLYGVDFDRITDEQARDLERPDLRNYRDQRWLYDVVTERANIELMFNDRYWAPFEFKQDYPVRRAGASTSPRWCAAFIRPSSRNRPTIPTTSPSGSTA